MRKLLFSLLCLIQIAAFAEDLWETRSEGQALPLPVSSTQAVAAIQSPLLEIHENQVSLPHGFRGLLLLCGATAVSFTFYTAWSTRRQTAL